MKKMNVLKKRVIMAVLFLTSAVLFSQAPNGINYQAVVRDNNGDLMTNESIDVRFTVLEDSTSNVYQEEQSMMTNAYGLFSAVIGHGNVMSGSFSDIDWANHEEYVKVEIDAGSGYTDMGTSQLQSVPYALNAANVEWDRSDNGSLSYSDTLPSGNSNLSQVAIYSNSNLTNNSEVLKLQAPGSSSDFQFMEMETKSLFYPPGGGLPIVTWDTKASIEGDGSANFRNLKADTLGSSAVPDTGAVYQDNVVMAWGYLSTNGTIYSDFGIASVTDDGTGLATVTLDNAWTDSPAIMMTPITSTSNSETVGVDGVSNDSNEFSVKMFDSSNNLKVGSFMVVVYGRMK